jgi:hypothetical protein
MIKTDTIVMIHEVIMAWAPYFSGRFRQRPKIMTPIAMVKTDTKVTIQAVVMAGTPFSISSGRSRGCIH